MTGFPVGSFSPIIGQRVKIDRVSLRQFKVRGIKRRTFHAGRIRSRSLRVVVAVDLHELDQVGAWVQVGAWRPPDPFLLRQVLALEELTI